MFNENKEPKQMVGRVWRKDEKTGQFVCTNEPITVTKTKTSNESAKLDNPIDQAELDALISKLEEENKKRYFDVAIDDALSSNNKERFQIVMKQMFEI